ncbi:hypothetical protein GCM10023214_06940 [Amycolatopsis dongchuanensis]|uniref:Uncharacterized protein n=1 Tax=Amycolatopsis dongchuanensis TaxID=1070866 RepID=A0ABP9Q171_9PSEU
MPEEANPGKSILAEGPAAPAIQGRRVLVPATVRRAGLTGERRTVRSAAPSLRRAATTLPGEWAAVRPEAPTARPARTPAAPAEFPTPR